MQELTTTWLSSGEEIVVTTNRLPEESEEAFRNRHEEAVAASLAQYPED